MKIKVSIVDDHPIVLKGMDKILSDHPDIELIHVSRSADMLFNNLYLQLPDVLLLDIQMPGVQGDELAKEVSRRYPQVAILALTNMDHPFYVRNMFKNGARGYILKSANQRQLIEAIVQLSRGEKYVDETLKDTLFYGILSDSPDSSVPTLTKREQEILELISEELTSQQIAKKLFITVSTVENHRINLFLKFGVKNAVGLVKKGMQLGLIR
jgi:DNA-binding NarL/FixJ family response regulator